MDRCVTHIIHTRSGFTKMRMAIAKSIMCPFTLRPGSKHECGQAVARRPDGAAAALFKLLEVVARRGTAK